MDHQTFEVPEMDSAHDYAQMFALVADLEAEKAYLEGMKASNMQRIHANEALAHDEPQFIDVANRMEEIADKLRKEI